jgi:hypothetical protein
MRNGKSTLFPGKGPFPLRPPCAEVTPRKVADTFFYKSVRREKCNTLENDKDRRFDGGSFRTFRSASCEAATNAGVEVPALTEWRCPLAVRGCTGRSWHHPRKTSSADDGWRAAFGFRQRNETLKHTLAMQMEALVVQSPLVQSQTASCED